MAYPFRLSELNEDEVGLPYNLIIKQRGVQGVAAEMAAQERSAEPPALSAGGALTQMSPATMVDSDEEELLSAPPSSCPSPRAARMMMQAWVDADLRCEEAARPAPRFLAAPPGALLRLAQGAGGSLAAPARQGAPVPLWAPEPKRRRTSEVDTPHPCLLALFHAQDWSGRGEGSTGEQCGRFLC